MKVRSKREAEALAHDEERERERAAILQQLKEPAEGYTNIGRFSPMHLDVCLRCSAVIYGRERHDAWHSNTASQCLTERK